MGVRRFPDRGKTMLKGARWAALRLRALRRDGFACRECGAAGRLEVDHITPHRGDPALFFEINNLQTLCAPCHSRKTLCELGHPAPDPRRRDWRNAIRALQGATERKETSC
jgi:5-methylcytosine-specific restriction endonuclease McrA